MDQPATIVSANAGCGKTTLVTDFVRTSSLPFVWYQIDPSDLDLAVFFGYLVYGLRGVKEDFGQVSLGFISDTENLSSKTDQLVDVFVNEVSEQVEEKTIVVLDDFHHVDTSEPIAAAVDRLIQYLPDVLHIVITTRAMPNLSVTRLRSKGLIGVIDRQDLLFTQSEVQQLFAEMVGQPLSDELLKLLYERTHGWATGLQLIAQAIEQRSQSLGNQAGGLRESSLLEILKQSEEEIFDYFAEEVLSYEQPEMQDALMKLSIFNRIDPQAASCALPAEEANQLLASLQRRNLFVSHLEDGSSDEYSFHPMFRRFLRRRLKAKLGEAGVRDLNRQFADHLMKLGRWQRAGLLYAEAHDVEAISNILIEHGRELLDAGLFEIIKRAYGEINDSPVALHPEIARLRAQIARIEGDLDLAERLFIKSATDARAIGDARCEAASLHGLASALTKRGQHARAFAIANEALAKAPADDLTLQAQCEHTIGNCQFLAGIATGDFEQAIQTWRRAVEMAERAGNERLARIISHNIGLPYSFTGNFARAREWFSHLIEGELARVPVPQQALAYCNLARADLVAGDLETCERRLEKAMELCRLFNLTLERAEAHELHGNLCRERGHFSTAREHYLQAEDLYRDSGIQLDSRELPDEQIRLLLAEKNISRARDAAEKLLEKRLAKGLAVPVARARLMLGRAMIESGAGNPRELLEQALSQFTVCRANLWISRTRLLLARACYIAGDKKEAANHLTEALKIARDFNYANLIKTEAERAPELFTFALSEKIEADYLNSLGVRSQESGVRDKTEGAAQAASASAAVSSNVASQAAPRPLTPDSRPLLEEREIDLTINMLGPVKVMREQHHALAPDAWTLSRALKILCFIASRHNHRATKEVIIETFWADTPVEDIDKNFWPTISYIRRALNSNQDVKKNFIRYRESAYYLNPEFNYLIDTEEFERLIAVAHARRREGDNEAFANAMTQALELYRGDFVEDFYENWTEEPRAYYRNLYFATLKEMADHFHREGEYERSISYSKAILSRDPYREDVHRQLMDAYAKLGNRAAVKEQYESLKSLLMEELGVDPLAETTATYKKLLGLSNED